MESNVGSTSILLELDIKGSSVCREHKSRWVFLCAICVGRGADRPVDGKLSADFGAAASESAGFPDGKAGWVAVVGVPLWAGCVIEETMIIKFFGWVIGVYVLATLSD